VFEFRAEQSAKQKLAARAAKEAGAKEAPPRMPDAANVSVAPPVPPRPEKKELPLPQRLLQNEAEARLKAGRRRRHRVCRAAGVVLVESFLHFGRQGRGDGRRL
jgi:hypothetical protein